MLVWHSASFGCSAQKKKKNLVWYLLLYLGSSEVIWVWEIYYSSESWVRTLYDPSPWIWVTHWEWGLGFFGTRSPGSLFTSPSPSYNDLLRSGVLGMSCSTLSHITTFLSQLVRPFSTTSIHHFSYPFSSSSILIERVLALWTTSSFDAHHLSFNVIHLDVGWVTLLTWFCDIWHCIQGFGI